MAEKMNDKSLGGQSLLKNFLAGSGLQIANYVFPLIQIPYLARILSVEGIGIFAFVTGLIAYCSVVIDWGFQLGATRQVARHRLDKEELYRIYWTTLTARLILLGVSLLLLAIIAVSPVGRPVASLLAIGSISLLAGAITPDWYFQGLERMVRLSVASFMGRLFTLIMVFLLIRHQSDVPILIALTCGSQLLIAVVVLVLGRRHLPAGRPMLNVRGALRQIVEYRHFFFTRVSIMAYTMSSPVVLGVISGPIATGIFSGAERISRAILALLNQASQTIFPRVSALMANDIDSAVVMLRRLGLAQILWTSVLSALLIIFAEPIIMLLLGKDFQSSVEVLKILGFLPVIIGVSNILGIQIMIPLGMQKEVFHITLVSAILFLGTLIFMGRSWGAIGAAYALMIAEIFVTLCQICFIFIRHQHILIGLIKGVPKKSGTFSAENL